MENLESCLFLQSERNRSELYSFKILFKLLMTLGKHFAFPSSIVSEMNNGKGKLKYF